VDRKDLRLFQPPDPVASPARLRAMRRQLARWIKDLRRIDRMADRDVLVPLIAVIHEAEDQVYWHERAELQAQAMKDSVDA
jgi:hypothetical protein